MSESSNLRTKTPRPLAVDGRLPDAGLTHAYRWGTLPNDREAAVHETDSGLPGNEKLPTTNTGRVTRTPSTIPPSSLRSRAFAAPYERNSSFDSPSDQSPTPPPVAIELLDAAPRSRRGGQQKPRGLDHGSGVLPAIALPKWAYWAAASVLALVMLSATALLRRTQPVALAQAAMVLPIEPHLEAGNQLAAAGVIAEPSASAGPVAPSQVSLPAVVLHREFPGHIPIDGGVLHIPNSFHPREGGYDLIIHFHGDVAIVRESVEQANVNAVLAIVNWGIRSVPYRNIYKETQRFERLLAQIDQGVARRGFKGLELRRMALTAWSAGYGAIESILDTRLAPNAENDPLDAVILLDGIHAAFVDEDHHRLSEISVLPFLRAARAAANNRILFTLTHSEIDPILYASTTRSAELLLTSVGAHAAKSTLAPPAHLSLKAARGSIGRDTLLQPVTNTQVGSLHVLGYRGNTREMHAAHLLQMGSIALPELAQRWLNPAPPWVHPVVVDDAPPASVNRKLPAGRVLLSQLSERASSPTPAPSAAPLEAALRPAVAHR